MDGFVETNLEKFHEIVAFDRNHTLGTRLEVLTRRPELPNDVFTLTLEDFENGRVRVTRVDDATNEGYVARCSGTQIFCQATNYKYIHAWLQQHNIFLAS